MRHGGVASSGRTFSFRWIGFFSCGEFGGFPGGKEEKRGKRGRFSFLVEEEEDAWDSIVLNAANSFNLIKPLLSSQERAFPACLSLSQLAPRLALACCLPIAASCPSPQTRLKSRLSNRVERVLQSSRPCPTQPPRIQIPPQLHPPRAQPSKKRRRDDLPMTRNGTRSPTSSTPPTPLTIATYSHSDLRILRQLKLQSRRRLVLVEVKPRTSGAPHRLILIRWRSIDQRTRSERLEKQSLLCLPIPLPEAHLPSPTL